MSECVFYQNSGISTPSCPPPWSFHWPTIFDFYVYGFPVFFSCIFLLILLIRYEQIKEEYRRRLIVEQPT